MPPGRSVRSSPEKDKVINEIISSEKNYLDSLATVIEVFIVPLRSMNILSESEMQLQFGSWEIMYGIHKELYDNMRQSKDRGDVQIGTIVGNIFLHFSEFFRVYKSYLANFELAMNRRAELSSNNKKWTQFIEKQRHSDSRVLAGIEAIMIIPVQRIPRYRLLFDELLKHTPPNDPDYHSLNQSLSKIVDMAKENNSNWLRFSQCTRC